MRIRFLFGQVPRGWPLVNAICDYVHDRIIFGYANASPTKRILAITLWRCMNIPARYCAGYLSEIGGSPPLVESGLPANSE